MSYESPIEMFYTDTIQNLANQIRQETDDRIVCEVNRQCGVNIDRYELAKALKYDRDQYNKGYQDAMNDARVVGEWKFCGGIFDGEIIDGNEWRCSICGETPWYHKSPMESGYEFCPYCGAKMKGGE